MAKYYLEFDDYKDCFVEVADKWTMKEVKALTSSTEENYFDIFKKKVESIFIKDVNGKELRDVNMINDDFLDNVDIAVVGFLGTVLVRHVRDRRSLGGMSVRPLSTTSESKTVKN